MEKKTASLLMFTLLLTSMLTLAFNIQPARSVENDWWDSNWMQRRRISITENSGYSLTNFPVEVSFEHDGRVKPNGTDIRVVDNSVEIPSYVQECNSTQAKVIFETNLTALESKTIHIYYGNPSSSPPNYPLVPITILEGNTGHAIIDNSVYIGWDYTSWGWSNPVELWNDFRLDFNGNSNPTDDSDLIRDYGSRQGGIGRHRRDIEAIGLGDHQSYVQTPVYIDIKFTNAMLRVYRNHPWVETTQADFLHMFSTSWDYANYGLGSEQNIIDGQNVTQITPSPPYHYPWNEMYLSQVNPQRMAYKDSSTGEIFGSIGLNIGAYNYYFAAKEGSDWDRCIFYDFGTPDLPLEPYDQPPDCRIYWYGDNSNNFSKIERIATILCNQPTVEVVPDTITVPEDYLTIQEAINHANEGDTIYVRAGTYSAIVIEKSLNIKGEDKYATIIDGGGAQGVYVHANNVLVSNFTIQHGRPDIYIGNRELEACVNITIKDNIIRDSSEGVIRLVYTSGNAIMRNFINGTSAGGGLNFDWANDTLVHNNTLIQCDVAINGGWPSYNNTFLENNILGNGKAISMNSIFENNKFFHNNFINNSIQVDLTEGANIWDAGYPSGGNYWSDYTGKDLRYGVNQSEIGSDGIGDSAYVIDASNVDNYPLMRPYVPYENQTIYIRADGSVDPSGASIERKGDLYTFTGDITSGADGIVVARDNIVVDGADHTIQGTASGNGIFLSGRSNVTIKNAKISGFGEGIGLSSSSDNSISGNNITANNRYGVCLSSFSNNNGISGNNITANGWHGLWPNSGVSLDFSFNNSVSGNTITANNEYGVFLRYSGYNDISGNNITANNWNGVSLDYASNNRFSGNNITNNNGDGVYLPNSSNNTIVGNNITNSYYGVHLYYSSGNSVSANTITNNHYGVHLRGSDYNSISGNNITANNHYGIWLESSSNNVIYHNNFVDNTRQVLYQYPLIQVWDDGYPSGGNYWSDYVGVDVKRGPGQDLLGSDGIGDVAYVIDADNVDHYPLMTLYGAPPPPTYTLTITTTVGGTTDPAHGTYSYTVNSTVQVTAIPNIGYLFDYWELDSANVGSANPYSVYMDKDHTLKAVFSPIPPPLSASISPLSASILVGQSVAFTSTVSGGYTPYSYQWYLNGNPVSGATSTTWTLAPTAGGIYYIHLKVTDAKGNTTQSQTARITAATVPVGGYSFPIQVQTKAEPVLPYIALIAVLTAIFTKLRPKTKRKR